MRVAFLLIVTSFTVTASVTQHIRGGSTPSNEANSGEGAGKIKNDSNLKDTNNLFHVSANEEEKHNGGLISRLLKKGNQWDKWDEEQRPSNVRDNDRNAVPEKGTREYNKLKRQWEKAEKFDGKWVYIKKPNGKSRWKFVIGDSEVAPPVGASPPEYFGPPKA